MTAVRNRPTDPARAQDRVAPNAQRRGLLVVAALLAAPAFLLFSMAFAQYRATAALERNGVVTPAEIVGASTSSKTSDRVRVAFATVEGRLVEASIPVDSLDRSFQGATVLVRYDPQNPKRVRTLDNWNPTYQWTALTGVMLLFLAGGLGQRAWRWPRRLLRVASKGPRQTMTLTGVIVPGKAPTPWAVLSVGGAPAHAFRLADESDLPAAPVDVEVIGDVRRRRVVVVDTPQGRIWPAGRLRRPPKRGEPYPPLTAPAPEQPPFLDRRGDAPTLPPEVAERLRRSQRRRRGATARCVALLPLTLVVTVPVVLPDIIGARQHGCVEQPAPRDGGEPGVIPQQALPAFLPQVAGFPPAGEEMVSLGGFDSASAPVLLEDAGFLYGAQRTFQSGAAQVIVQVLQFSSERGAFRYEALRMTTWCAEKPRRVPVPAGSGASGSVVNFDDVERTRFAFIRGNRDYVVNVTHVDSTRHHDIVSAVLSTAR